MVVEIFLYVVEIFDVVLRCDFLWKL